MNKLHIEALWNQLIYSKFSKNIRINKEEMRKNILIQFKNEKKNMSMTFQKFFLQKMLAKF